MLLETEHEANAFLEPTDESVTVAAFVLDAIELLVFDNLFEDTVPCRIGGTSDNVVLFAHAHNVAKYPVCGNRL
jgi:hypothetical protein